MSSPRNRFPRDTRLVALTLFALIAVSASSPAALDPVEMQTAGGPTIAVLAFTNLKPEPNTDWIGEGAAETVTTKLAGLSELVVTERSQVKQVVEEQDFQQLDLTDNSTAARAGRLLGAQRVVVGTYAAQNAEIMFNVRVVDVETGEVLNTASLTGQMAGIFDTLYQVADAVIESFEKKVAIVDAGPRVVEAPPEEQIIVDAEERAYLREEHRTSSVEAFEAYSRGLMAVNYDDRERYFNLAIQSDGGFAWAYYQRGETRAARNNYRVAVGDYEQATRLNPRFYDAWYAQGVAYERLRQPERARVAYERFVEVAPPSRENKVKNVARTLGQAGKIIMNKFQNKLQKKLDQKKDRRRDRDRDRRERVRVPRDRDR